MNNEIKLFPNDKMKNFCFKYNLMYIVHILPPSLILKWSDFIMANLKFFPITFERLPLLKDLRIIKIHFNSYESKTIFHLYLSSSIDYFNWIKTNQKTKRNSEHWTSYSYSWKKKSSHYRFIQNCKYLKYISKAESMPNIFSFLIRKLSKDLNCAKYIFWNTFSEML